MSQFLNRHVSEIEWRHVTKRTNQKTEKLDDQSDCKTNNN